MKAIRVADNTLPHMLNPGEITNCHGRWLACTPTGLLGSLRNHTVTEEPDGTITVEQPIRCGVQDETLWLGYLKLGRWITC